MRVTRLKASCNVILFLGLACFVLIPHMLLAQAQRIPGVNPIGIDANEQQIKEATGIARAGRKLTPKQWPGAARVAVCLSFDVDNESLWRETPLPVPLSQGEYGATTGLPRILELLARYRVPASFYIPAMSAMLHPEMIPNILKEQGHEIAVHGWVHEELSIVGDAAKEEQLLKQSMEYLTHATGKRPVGFRAPSWEFSPHTLDIIRKLGFLYDSSMMAMDEPYEVLSHGQATGLIELPIGWIADDYPYYEPDAGGSMPVPENVFKIYKAEFDGAYADGTMFILTMHPHITGHRSRIVQLDNLIAYMKSKPGVWFATLQDVASYVRQSSIN
jgi:peptidoglycan/xylan/chitin deacetylase (PgdA/CDA1 family)